MQERSPKNSNFFFEIQLDQDQVEAIAQLEEDVLKKLIQNFGKRYQKEMKKNHDVTTFLNNYRQIMQCRCQFFNNHFSVNVCLHFALLYSQHLLMYLQNKKRENRQNDARTLMKQTEQYALIENTDAMLLSVSMNNLAFLYYRRGKIYKALMVGLKAINIMEEHLIQLKTEKKKYRIIEDVVVFVNILNTVQIILKKIKKIDRNQQYQDIFRAVNNLGHSLASKYLGQSSLFTKKFTPFEVSIILPIYRDQQPSQQVQPVNIFQTLLKSELQNIYLKLKDIFAEPIPQVYYIREHLVEQKPPEISSIIEREPEPQTQQLYTVCHSDEFFIDQWETQISILRDLNEQTYGKQFDFEGHLQFKTAKNGIQLALRLDKNTFQKIITCLNVHDVLPYQIQLKKMSRSQFFRRLFINFIKINDKGEIQIIPRTLGLIEPIQRRFCGQNTIIFVNHIYFKKFRIAICPLTSCQTLYLDLEFKNDDILKCLTLIQLQHQSINQLKKRYDNRDKLKQFHVSFSKAKKIKITNVEYFMNKIIKILDKFEEFIGEDEQQALTEMNSMVSIGDCLLFYQYIEQHEDVGKFFELKYRSNVNHIEVYAKNTFKTASPSGLKEAKGTTVYSPQQFMKDFSFNLKLAKKHFMAFASVIVQRYHLRVFEREIQENEEDHFEQNAIYQSQLICKFFKRKFIEFEDHVLPVTMELICVNNEKPLGIRVSAYEPIKCIQSGLFIYLTSQYWQYCSENLNDTQIKQQPQEGDQMKKQNILSNFQKKYFLTNWLKEQGWEIIFQKLVIVNRSLQLKGFSSKFCRLQQLI